MGSCAAFSCLPVSFFFFRGSGMGQIIILSMDWSKLQTATVRWISQTTEHTTYIHWMIQFNSIQFKSRSKVRVPISLSSICMLLQGPSSDQRSQGRPWGVKHSPKPKSKICLAWWAFNKYKYHSIITSVNIIYNTIPVYSKYQLIALSWNSSATVVVATSMR